MKLALQRAALAQPRQSGGADDDAASVAGSVAGDGPEEAAAICTTDD